MRTPIAVLFALTLLAAPAHAQPAPDISGEWVFESELTDGERCVITGRTRIVPAAEANTYTLTTTGGEVCDIGWRWESEQACTARRKDARLTVTCELVRAEPGNYAPDHFILQIRSSGLMVGTLVSTRRGPATWRRPSPALVS